MKKGTVLLAVDILLLFCAIGLYLLFYQYFDIQFTDSTYTMQDGQPVVFDPPLFFNTDKKYFQVDATLHLPFWFADPFIVRVDDCLEELIINGESVQEDIPFCIHGGSKSVQLSKYLHRGDNTLTARIRDDGGYGAFHISLLQKHTPVVLIADGLLAAAVFLFGISRLSAANKQK